MKRVHFLAVGDTVVDDFIRIKDAAVHCRIDNEACELCVRFGDKVPFESSTVIYGVGNAANAAVSAARLGLSTGFLTHVGNDERGKTIIKRFKSENISTDGVAKDKKVPTNYHYVLSYESERTILVHQNEYDYQFPKNLPAPKALYFSSISATAVQYREDLISYLEKNPDVFFAFQPGVFEIKSGIKAFERFYKRADFFACNKEEAERILSKQAGSDMEELLASLRELGPKIVVITDGRSGAYAADAQQMLSIPMYPDVREPYERTGAGDAFASTVAAALVSGKPLAEALLWGPINSMSVVQKVGAQEGLLTKKELEQYLAQAPETYHTTPFNVRTTRGYHRTPRTRGPAR